MNSLIIKVGDMIETPGHTRNHLYRVSLVAHGGLGQESVVELVPLDQSKPSRGADRALPLVPLQMIEAGCDAKIFIHTSLP